MRLLALVVSTVGLAMPLLGAPAPLSGAIPARPDSELVVLLHGLNRTPRSMKRLERALAAEGYAVLNLRYPASRQGVEDLAAHLGRAVIRSRTAPDQRVHFVTHSLGGIVVRHYLKAQPRLNVGRVVMLSPPNGGSELVDLMRKIPLLRNHPGPSRGQLGTGPEDMPARLGPVEFEVGVIVGERSLNPLFSWLIPGRDDGMVSVERAKVAGMTDFLVVPRTHTFIMRSQEAIRQTRAFLRNGNFERRPEGPASGVPSGEASPRKEGGEHRARGWRFPALPSIKGLTLGSTLAEVVAGLGKPGSERDNLTGGVELGMGPIKELGYPGLVVQLCQPDADRDFHVWQIEISGKEWRMTPGVRVGMTRREVTGLLGNPFNSDVNPADRTERIHFSLQPPLEHGAYVWIELSGGKVVAFGMTEDWS